MRPADRLDARGAPRLAEREVIDGPMRDELDRDGCRRRDGGRGDAVGAVLGPPRGAPQDRERDRTGSQNALRLSHRAGGPCCVIELATRVGTRLPRRNRDKPANDDGIAGGRSAERCVFTATLPVRYRRSVRVAARRGIVRRESLRREPANVRVPRSVRHAPIDAGSAAKPAEQARHARARGAAWRGRATTPRRSRCSRASSPSASGRACISARPARTATASITSSPR